MPCRTVSASQLLSPDDRRPGFVKARDLVNHGSTIFRFLPNVGSLLIGSLIDGLNFVPYIFVQDCGPYRLGPSTIVHSVESNSIETRRIVGGIRRDGRPICDLSDI